MQKIVQNSEGQFIEAKFNEQGIIEKLDGTISEYTVENLDINIQQELVHIHKKYSGDGCFNIEIQNNKDYLTLTNILTEVPGYFPPRDNLTYTIYFDKNDKYLLKDDYLSIDKVTKTSVISANPKDSLLPLIRYNNNVLIQYFGWTMPPDDPGSRKYEYSPDKKNILCYHIMSGDVWQKYMTATVSLLHA